MTDEHEWRDYRKRMNILNNAAYAAVGVCPHKYPHPTFKALVKICHEIDALIDDGAGTTCRRLSGPLRVD